jgi:thiamine-monophosphate kinase
MKMSGEDKLIERIRRRIPSATDGVLRLGIGDDAAVLRPVAGTEWAITCDQFIEGVHFLVDVHSPEVVGYKALARATSDLAAMGAIPRFFLMSLMLPASRSGRWLDGMLAGMSSAAEHFGLTLIGGDTAQSPGVGAHSSRFGKVADGKIAINLTVLGELETGKAVGRSGARRGDIVFVTGELGAAQLGLELILRGIHRQRRWKPLLTAHNHPHPAIKLGRWLVRQRLVSAMMDISDGLSTDLARLCRASHVGARINEQRLPVVSVPDGLQAKGIDAKALALHGGDDYGLLFTVPRRKAASIPSELFGTEVSQIGEIVSGNRVQLISANGKATPLLPKGWDHFS